MTSGNKIDVYSNLSEQSHVHQNWTENEDTYIEMSGGLIDTLQKSDSLKRSMEHSTAARLSSSIADGYMDIDTLRRQQEDAKKGPAKTSDVHKKSGISKANVCAAVLFILILSVLLSVAISVSMHLLFVRVIDQLWPLRDFTAFNCSAKIASRCVMSQAYNGTYNCTTGGVQTEATSLTTTGIQCVQLNGSELDSTMETTLIYDEESHEAMCYCTITSDINNNFTFSLVCGIWVSQCFSQ